MLSVLKRFRRPFLEGWNPQFMQSRLPHISWKMFLLAAPLIMLLVCFLSISSCARMSASFSKSNAYKWNHTFKKAPLKANLANKNCESGWLTDKNLSQAQQPKSCIQADKHLRKNRNFLISLSSYPIYDCRFQRLKNNFILQAGGKLEYAHAIYGHQCF